MNRAMEMVIETDRLSKIYGRKGTYKALNEVSLNVRRGEIYAFLGLNGAGKTTMIRMLLGLIKPSSGQARLWGQPVSPAKYALWQKVGSLVETPSAYPDLTVTENLELVRRLRGLADPQAIERTLAQLQLTPYRHHKAQQLSLGNAQRLGLAKALLHQPELLILDEPSNGLDPAGIVEIRELLLHLAASGTTVFISSHLLTEVARIAQRIGIIHQGQLVQELATSELKTRLQRRLLLDMRNRSAGQQSLAAAGIVLEPAPEGCWQTHQPQALEAPERVAELLVQAGQPPTRLQVEQEELEAYFLRVIGGNHAQVA